MMWKNPLSTIHEEDNSFKKRIPQFDIYKYVKGVIPLPPSPKLVSVDGDPLTDAGITNTTDLILVSNYASLASRLNRVGNFVSKEYDPLCERALSIRRELRKEHISIYILAYRLGLSQKTVRRFIKEMYIQGFFV